jgi:hypothetical protein
MKKLTRYAGFFTVLRGSDSVVHFRAIDTSTLRGALELYEVMLYRGMRRVAEDQAIGNIDSVKPTLALIAATAIDRLVENTPAELFHLTFMREFLGTTLEALRLVRCFRESRQIKVSATFSDRTFLTGFSFLHRGLSGAQENIIIGPLSVELPYSRTAIRDGSASLAVANLLKSDSNQLWQILDHQYASITGDTSSLLLVARTSIDGVDVSVQDINGNEYKLPDLHKIQRWCESYQLFATVLRLDDMDRDFLLPFEGRYAVSILYISAQPTNLLQKIGFRPLTEALQSDRLGSVVVFDETAVRNYDQIFEPDLPTSPNSIFHETDRLPWDDDWDPNKITDWRGGNGAHDPFVYAHQLSTADYGLEAMVRDLVMSSLCTLHGRALGDHALIYAAWILKSTDSPTSLACVLDIIIRHQKKPRQVRQLIRILVPEFEPLAEDSGVECQQAVGLALYVLETLKTNGWNIDLKKLVHAASLTNLKEGGTGESVWKLLRNIVVQVNVAGLRTSLGISAEDLMTMSFVLFRNKHPKLASNTIKMAGVIVPNMAKAYSTIAQNSPNGTTARSRYEGIARLFPSAMRIAPE